MSDAGVMEIPRVDDLAALFAASSPAWAMVNSDGHAIPHLRDTGGHIARLDAWTIHEDGRVEPSVECLEDGCGFHAFVRLMEWAP